MAKRKPLTSVNNNTSMRRAANNTRTDDGEGTRRKSNRITERE